MAEKVDEGGWAVGEGPPSAAAYNSEEERLGALMPDTDEVALMEKRKLKVQKLIAKKKTVSLNPRKRYQQRKEERLHEKQKVAAALALVKEAAQESEESRRMFVEERRTWDAYELNTRNHSRMIKQEQENGAAAAEKRREEEGRRLACEEEGLTFDHGIVARYRRWRASPALAAVLPAHPCPAHAVRLSADGKWILSGGDDLVVRLWDIEAFAKELADPNANKAARAAKRVGQVAADVALGWKCVRELTGHAAAVRDVDFHPHFKGLPCGLAGTQRVGTPGTEAGGGAEASVAGIDATSGRGGTHTNDGGKTAPNQAGELVRVENMLASASADLSVRVWDLSYNPRIARFILRGHTGVVYACRFTPSGNRLASCSADTTVRLWNVLEGTEVFCYRGHTSPVTSLCFSATGRYLVSCSDIGERAIRMWFTGMPLYDREAAPFGLRLRWTRSGLVKRLRASTEPSAMDFFLNRQEDREARESSDESAGEKEFKERLKVPKSVLDQCTENPCPSKAVSDGFSLTVTLLNDSGKDVRTDEYYRGCKLVLRARSLKRFTGLYVAGVSAEGLWEGFDSRGGCRYGAFFKDVPDGMLLSAGRSIAAGDGFNRTAGGVYEVGLRWKANPREGVGWLMFRAAFTFPTHVGKRNTIGRQTVWVTLRERAPPMASAALFSTTKLKPRKRNFDTVGHTRLFANAIKNGDWAEASMLLSASARLNFGKTIARGAADVMDEIRNALGKNVIVGDGLSVGVAWTSIRMSHEPPAPPSPPTSPAAEHPATTSKSPRSTGSADASTVVAGTNKRQGSRNKQARDGDRRDSTAAHERNGDSAGLTRERPSTAMKKRARQKHKKRRARREGSVSGGSTGTRGCQLDRTEPRREGSQRRRRTGSARSLSTGRPGRRKASKRGGRRNAATSGSSGEEDAAALRASVEQDVRAELKHLRRLRDAGVESWKELGEATGALSLSKARKKASVRARAGRKGLLEGAGIIVKDPQANLKVLVWNDCFGADVPEMRMPLPEFYPISSTPYDQHEEVSARAMAEALAVGERASQAIMEEIRAERKEKRTNTVEEMVDAVLERDERLRKVAARRREGIFNSEDLAASYPAADPRLAPLPRPSGPFLLGNGNHHQVDGGGERGDHRDENQDNDDMAAIDLPAMEPNIVHQKLEGAASREKRRKQEERLLRRHPPIDPPAGFHTKRRRGGLGILPGAALLGEVPVVGDWEKDIARKRGGLLRQFESRFGGLICHQDAINAVAYSPDGRRLASASSDGTIKLWDPLAGKQMRVLSGHHGGLSVWHVAWSGDSVYLASCGADRAVVVWNTASSEPFVRRFLGHSDHVTRCAFAGEQGEAILSCGSDGTVRKWVLTPNAPAPPPKPFVTHKTRTWVMLNWRPASGSNEDVTAYVVSWRLGRKGNFDDEVTVAGDQLRRDVTGLLPGSLYFFRVAAVNRMGQGGWSEMTNMVDTEMDFPIPIEKPLTEDFTPTSITISFFAPRPTLLKMKIKHFTVQAKGGGRDFDEGESSEFAWAHTLAEGGALKASEKASRKGAPGSHALTATGPDGHESKAHEEGKNSSGKGKRRARKVQGLPCRRKAHHHLMSLTYRGLLPGTDYQLRVAATNSIGQGAFSSPTYSVRTPAVRPGQCPPPKVTMIFLKAIHVSWFEGDDGGSAVTGFVVRRTEDGELETLCGRNKRSHLFEGLKKGHPYSFQVRAENNKGIGPWSEASDLTSTLTECPGPPPAPVLARLRPPPGPLSLWLSLSMPKDDGGDPVTAVLLETREHGGTRAPEWARCERHSVPVPNARDLVSHSTPEESGTRAGGKGRGGGGGGTAGEHDVVTKIPHSRTTCSKVVVLADCLKPRTYYSFRATAINARGAGKPGLPCRRIRTSAPKPPSWMATADATVTAAARIGGGAEGAGRDATGGAATHSALVRAACSGLGACTVVWEEPFFNGARIVSYEVETVSLGPAINTKGGGGEARDDLSADVPSQHGSGGQAVTENAADVVVVSRERGLGGETREVLKRFPRGVPSHARHAVIRGLTTGGEYMFRIAATNAAGKGEHGPWSEVVRVLDPADDTE